MSGILMKLGFVPEHSSISSMYRELKKNHNAPEAFHAEVRFMNRFMNFCSLEVAPILIPTDSELSRMIIFATLLKEWIEPILFSESENTAPAAILCQS
ncbi:MAG: hypothetical protein K0M40_13430 [Prolixibacteraceae bacterium]|nr:hypothetical protein [Prolixibacteraceae bacterium]